MWKITMIKNHFSRLFETNEPWWTQIKDDRSFVTFFNNYKEVRSPAYKDFLVIKKNRSKDEARS